MERRAAQVVALGNDAAEPRAGRTLGWREDAPAHRPIPAIPAGDAAPRVVGPIRPPLPYRGRGVDDGRRARVRHPAAGRGGPPERGGCVARRQRQPTPKPAPTTDEKRRGAARRPRGSRRPTALRARDMSRSMSRQLSAMMSRVGRSVRQDDSRVSRVAPPTPRRSPCSAGDRGGGRRAAVSPLARAHDHGEVAQEPRAPQPDRLRGRRDGGDLARGGVCWWAAARAWRTR